MNPAPCLPCGSHHTVYLLSSLHFGKPSLGPTRKFPLSHKEVDPKETKEANEKVHVCLEFTRAKEVWPWKFISPGGLKKGHLKETLENATLVQPETDMVWEDTFVMPAEETKAAGANSAVFERPTTAASRPFVKMPTHLYTIRGASSKVKRHFVL